MLYEVITIDSVIGGADVLIDFTFHEATLGFARAAAKNGVAMVIGTTGLTADELATRNNFV